MQGYPDGLFKPGNPITRAEALVALEKAAALADAGPVVFNKPGTYGPVSKMEVVQADVVIKADGVKLQNKTIKGNLTIDEEVGQGTVILSNVTVEGDTFVRGGGPDSILISGGQYKNIRIENVNGRIHIVALGVEGPDGKPVDVVVAEEAAENEVILEGEFDSVQISASHVAVSTQGNTKIDSITVDKNVSGTTLTLSQGTKVENVTLHSKVEINGDGEIKDINQTTGMSFGGGGGGGGGGADTNKEPHAPGNPAPAHKAENIALSPTLGWTCSDPNGDALTYDIYLGTEQSLVEDLDPSVKKAAGYGDTTYTPGQLAGLTPYYWIIVAKDGKGGEKESPLWQFTTGEPEVVTDTIGYFRIENDDQTKVIEGFVTHNRGGAGISGATVTYPADIFETPGDLLITKEGYALGKIQNVYWKYVDLDGPEQAGEDHWSELDYIYEAPLRDPFSPSWSDVPPVINVEGLEPGDTVSGTLAFDLNLLSEQEIYVYYVYLGGEQLSPRDSSGANEDSATVTIDTTVFPNGPTYLKVLAYDYNGNLALSVFPIIIQNGAVHNEIPGALPGFDLYSETYGINWGMYSLPVNQLNDQQDDPGLSEDGLGARSVQEDVSLRCRLSWEPAAGAQGYKVYRSFDGIDYRLIGTIKTCSLQDTSSLLDIGKETYYKVVPYNSFGDNEAGAITRSTTPLPAINVFLDSPQNGETGVDLAPTFSWHLESIGGNLEDYQTVTQNVYQDFSISLYDATSYSIYEEDIKDETDYQLPFELEPGGVYSWDITSGIAYVYAENAEETGNGESLSISYAGYDYTGSSGSMNGENMFTTLLADDAGDAGFEIEYMNFADSKYVDGQVLVKTKNQADLGKTLELFGSRSLKTWDDIGWRTLEVPAGESVESFIHKLLQDPNVIIAQPDYLLDVPEPLVDNPEQKRSTAKVLTEDVPVGAEVEMETLWGLNNIHAEEAWQQTTGSPDVILAIIDTGVEGSHPEFADKTFIGAYDATGGGVPFSDLNGHGTHVAGIAGDDGRNGKIAGLAWDCPIMPVKVEDLDGSIKTSYLIEATNYVAQYAADHPEDRMVINMSIGGRGYNFAFKDAIDHALAEGVVFVTSAGNDGKRIPQYPSSYNGVIAVAASTPFNKKADFSSTGPWISVAAPGVLVYSTYLEGSYEYLQGTSMASPYVTGAAALLLSKYPDLSPVEVKSQLEKTAQGSGFTEELGYGVIDLEAMLGEIQPVDYGALEVTTNILETVSVDGLGLGLGLGYGVVSVLDENDNLVTYGTTGEEGDHLFLCMKPGDYSVVLSYYNPFGEEYQYAVEEITILPGQTAGVEIRFELPSSITSEVIHIEDIELEPEEQPYLYEFTVAEESFYEFKTSFFTDNCDTVLTLLDAEGNVIAQNDDNDGGYYSRILTELPAGDYSVEVKEFDMDPLKCTLEVKKLTLYYEE